MFTLSGLILEVGENLFWDFWSPFSISFLSFSARRNYLKKSQTGSGLIFRAPTSAWRWGVWNWSRGGSGRRYLKDAPGRSPARVRPEVGSRFF